MPVKPEPKDFKARQDLIDHVMMLSPHVKSDDVIASPIRGGRIAAHEKLAQIKPQSYGRTRNFLNGDVTYLSSYIRHGIVSLNEVRNKALETSDAEKDIEKFIQELTWRDFWQHLYRAHPEWIWNDIEPYKTGFGRDDYADDLPEDIAQGRTGVACIDQFIKILLETGYMHNHTRMYVASYVVHWRRVKWQAGARWFLHHLLDGDPASNNLSWQWVASTFSNKPYIFNLENVGKYASEEINANASENKVLDHSYEDLSCALFPQKAKGE
jgi:deoxyribodipyrimidine photo-lyase